MQKILIILYVFLFSNSVFAQFSISGKIISTDKNEPIEYAIVSVSEKNIWAIADAKGEFVLKNIPKGDYILNISYLGFEKTSFPLKIDRNLTHLTFHLSPDNLNLEEVTVVAKRNSTPGTSFTIDQKALEHMQMLNVTDATALLPGGKTNRQFHLASGVQRFAINGTSSEKGNALFGVGVEIDGQRISSNAQTGTDGLDTRNIASSNVESIEIITGVPSVEIGDATNGVVKINTRKGKSDYLLDLFTKPNSKQVALSKGFDLGKGVLNFNLEHSKSISDIASPYTSYARNALSLSYNQTFFKTSKPLALEYGISGNIGGYDSKSDPDRFVNTYNKLNDGAFRTHLNLRWLINSPFITNLEFYSGLNTNNRTTEISTNVSSSSSVPAIHSMNEGYFVGQSYAENPNADIIMIEPGYWYRVGFDESKVLNYNFKLKADNSFLTGNIKHNLKVGADFTHSQNNGAGTYYQEYKYAPTWRPYPYSALPANQNLALFIEDRIRVNRFELTAGLRSDQTFVQNSVYGNIQNWSPRVSGQYVFVKNKEKDLKEFTLKAGLGKTVKLPSFSTLFPVVNYRDILTFTPGTTAEGKVYYAYFTQPILPLYNPNLSWQSNIQAEISTLINYKGNRIQLIFSRDETANPYSSTSVYSPLTYKFTGQSALENSQIPIENREYSVNQNTGIVTVLDKTGVFESQTLPYREITRAFSNSTPINSSKVYRNRLSWIIDFKKIESLKTSFRLDGNYYFYKALENNIEANMPNSTIDMANGQPYKYIGFYVGGSNLANGQNIKNVNLNATAITHIPALKMIMSLRIESSLFTSSQNRSEYSNGNSRGFVIDKREDFLPSANQSSIYESNKFVAIYPEYYTSLDNLSEKTPFKETFLSVKESNPELYNELAKLVLKTNYDYYFKKNTVSPYFSANLNLTKEIGKAASLTFNANNFLNNLAKVKSSSTGGQTSLFESSYIPQFYYGLSLKLKI